MFTYLEHHKMHMDDTFFTWITDDNGHDIARIHKEDTFFIWIAALLQLMGIHLNRTNYNNVSCQVCNLIVLLEKYCEANIVCMLLPIPIHSIGFIFYDAVRLNDSGQSLFLIAWTRWFPLPTHYLYFRCSLYLQENINWVVKASWGTTSRHPGYLPNGNRS